MTSSSDFIAPPGGIEIPGTTAITHATDQQKNRSGQGDASRKRGPKRRKPTPDPQEDVSRMEPDAEDGDEEKSSVDYLA